MRVLNLGCGHRFVKGAIHHDRTLHDPRVDVAYDLNDLPWPWRDGEFDEVHAWSVLEHLQLDLLESLNEVWRILKVGGVLHIKVPYWRHETCWRDPTHRRGYTLETFDLFDSSTALGAEYEFYTQRRWRIIESDWVYRLDDKETPSGVKAIMEKVK